MLWDSLLVFCLSTKTRLKGNNPQTPDIRYFGWGLSHTYCHSIVSRCSRPHSYTGPSPHHSSHHHPYSHISQHSPPPSAWRHRLPWKQTNRRHLIEQFTFSERKLYLFILYSFETVFNATPTLPFLQLCPAQPGAQVQRPVTGWQRPLFSHRQRSWHPTPNRPVGHATAHKHTVW